MTYELPVWSQITEWLRRNAPRSYAQLHEGATPDALAHTRARLGTALPEELSAMLRMNNGVQIDPNDPDGMRPRPSGKFISDFYGILPTYLITRANEHMNAVYNDGERDGEWKRHWIPFAVESDWLYGLFVDGATGAVGSWSDGGPIEENVHPSLSAWLEESFHLMRNRADVYNEMVVWDIDGLDQEDLDQLT
ncbi:SMI1/KNR4 family protein [Streptomyces fenghuangensis]|uniref:SMI1/KNR4 family protein n=1 Tax=Streptomyces chitinivorans TaxID=1257027 RepID=A0ABW7HU85_9ACTN|nr:MULTISPECIES: SMI1/KNR4 family protein [Streptomyces]MCG3041246.1 SMI1/KNR4 family protein [Streptomyces sp. ICN903]MDH2409803.1 SMI1/KNR4 family protein [Streptomyces chitinivorans]